MLPCFIARYFLLGIPLLGAQLGELGCRALWTPGSSPRVRQSFLQGLKAIKFHLSVPLNF